MTGGKTENSQKEVDFFELYAKRRAAAEVKRISQTSIYVVLSWPVKIIIIYLIFHDTTIVKDAKLYLE